MKKILAIALILTTVSILPVSASVEHKVIKVIDGDTVYVDFNDNGIAEQDEKVRINGIDTFETKLNEGLNWQMKLYNLTQDEALGLGYYGKEFAKKELLNKSVKAEYTAEEKFDKNNRHLMSIYYDCNRHGKCKNYEQEVLKTGLATIYTKSNLVDELKPYQNLDKIKAYAEKSHSLNLVVLNKKNGKYHKLDCKYGWMSSQQELVNKPLVKYAPASCCYDNKINDNYDVEKSYIKPENLISRTEKYEKEIQNLINTNYIEPNSNLKLYFVYPAKENDKSGKTTEAGKELAKMINETKYTLDLALFGFENQPEIFKALVNAQKRGVQIRVIFDMNYKGRNTYYRTIDVIKALEAGTVRTDYDVDLSYYKAKLSGDSGNIIPGALMHNKYVISDMQKVWTGSANVSDTCTGGYNANISGVITSKIVAWLYTKDFEYMYIENKFHKDKPETYLRNIRLADGSELQVYFLPGKSANDLGIIPMMNSAQKYLYGLTFFYTNNKLINSAIDAHKRGADVKIILDAVEANAVHRKKHYLLRKEGISVKAENFGGKMHCKTFFADDEIFSFGSMNATTTAEYYNDENLVIVKNRELTKAIKKYFEELWEQIPEKWLYADPQPEGPDSPGSCSDGIDNDHDGLIDSEDPKCNYSASPHYK